MKQLQWQAIVKNKKDFHSLISFLKSQNIKTFKSGGLSIEFQEKSYVIPGEPRIEPMQPMSEEQIKAEEEANLFWSSGG